MISELLFFPTIDYKNIIGKGLKINVIIYYG